MDKRLEIGPDITGKTFGYTLFDNDGKAIITGDGFETEDAIIEDLSELSEALRHIFG